MFARGIDVVLRDLGKEVRDARRALGLTQEDAADRAKIDYKRYQRIEAGEVNVTINTIVRIATALDTTFTAVLAARTGSVTRARRAARRRS